MYYRTTGYKWHGVRRGAITLAAAMLMLTLLAVPGGAARAEGEIEWVRQFGTAKHDSADTVAATRWGTFVGGSAGGTLSGPDQSGSGGIYLRKYTAAGDVVWTRQFGSSGAILAITADSSGIYVAGNVATALPGETHAGFIDAFVRKYDHAGEVEWTRQFGTTESDYPTGIALSPTGLYISGATGSSLAGQTHAGNHDAFVRKYTTWGHEEWTHQFGTTGGDSAGAIAADASGIYVAGGTTGSLAIGQTNAGGYDAFLRKLDADGTPSWTRHFGGLANDYVRHIKLDASGVYLTGDAWTSNAEGVPQNYDIFVRKHGADGGLLWTQAVAEEGLDISGGLAVDASGVYLAGSTEKSLVTGQPNTGGNDIFIRRYTLGGQVRATQTLQSEGSEWITGISVGATGTYLSGGTNDVLLDGTHLGNSDAFLLKVPAPAAPTVAAKSSSILVMEGGTAATTGTYSDRNFGDNVALTASSGTVTKTGTNTGTWSWSMPAGDGPAAQSVTITADDGTGRTSAVTFEVSVGNVAPTAVLNRPAAANEGSAFTVSLTGPTDPSAADKAAGFEYAFDCGNGAGYSDPSTLNSASCAAPDNPRQTVKGVVIDKDGGTREYVAGVPVNNLKPTARFNAPAAVQPAASFTVSLIRRTDPGPRDRAASYEYAFDCGDGAGYAISNIASETCDGRTDVSKQTVKARIIDKDGGFTEYVKTVIVDGSAPTGTAVINAGAASTRSATVSVGVAATDTGGSGVRYVRISNSPAVAEDVLTQGRTFVYNASNLTLTWDLSNASYGGTAATGTKRVYVQWRDGAGNWSDLKTDTIMYTT